MDNKDANEMPEEIYLWKNAYHEILPYKNPGSVLYVRADRTPPQPDQPSDESRARAFWVIEQFIDGKSRGYWDGGNSRSFQPDINRAVQFFRKQDAFWATRGWHWDDVQITEHMILAALTAQNPAAAVELEALKRNHTHPRHTMEKTQPRGGA